jgi:phosphoglycerol transferase MdoB-like AlkP superfamily enzyme
MRSILTRAAQPVSPTSFPYRFRPLAILAAIYLLVSAGLRCVLWARFGTEAAVGGPQLLAILGLGAVNDAVEALYLFAAFAVYLAVLPQRWYDSRANRVVLAGATYVAVFGMLFLGAMEYFFFEEFDSRFNRVAVDYLVSPHEVLGNIYESYPVVPITAVAGIAGVVLTLALWPLLRRGMEQPTPARRRGVVLAGEFAALVLAVAFYPTDLLGRFDNRVANELVANGSSSFFRALRTNHLNYAQFYPTGDPQRLEQVLRQDLATAGGTLVSPNGLTRRFGPRADGLGRMNVVVLSEESFGAEFVGAYGDGRGLTPEFDALARDGVLFTRTYASGTRTVRGLEAMSASLPPIPGDSVVKRTGNAAVVTWGEIMQQLGYHTSFLYGGYGYFDNMNAYFSANGFAVSDRGDIPSPTFANIWGVADEDLFRHAIDYFDARAQEGAPFFSIVMTTSNHKPYTFPAGIPGVPESGGGREAGIRYADFAIGQFFREARKHDWFKDTLFVVMADHGARVYGAAQIPLYSYEIPFLVLAPGRLAPRRVDALTAQIDLAPTVLGVLGLPYEAPFFGRDVLHYPDPHRVVPFNHNQDVALLRDDELAILELHQHSVSVRHHSDPLAKRRDRDTYQAIPGDPELVGLATAYFQTASEMFQRGSYE